MGIIALFCFSVCAFCWKINPLNTQKHNAQWVNLLIHNFNNNTPLTPFNGNQWGQI